MARTSEDGRFGNMSGTQFGNHARRHTWTFEEPKADSGICRGPGSGVTREDIHEPTEKQSPSCCPKKSGFWVWTSGRFVNVLGEKDILVCVHTRNIPWAWGCFWYVKVPSSPYKRGARGQDSDFLELVQFAEGITVSLCSHFVLERVKNSLVLGVKHFCAYYHYFIFWFSYIL
jgi:hypothetical protein